MPNYRNSERMDSEHRGKLATTLRALAREGTLQSLTANGNAFVVLVQGGPGEASLVRDMAACHPIGVIAKPAKPEHVEVVVVNLASDNRTPTAVGFRDHRRSLVIKTAGLDADETIIYTSQTMVKILADGSVFIGKLDGTPRRLAFFDELETFRDEFLGHAHPTAATGIPSLPGKLASPAVPLTTVDVPLNETSTLTTD